MSLVKDPFMQISNLYHDFLDLYDIFFKAIQDTFDEFKMEAKVKSMDGSPVNWFVDNLQVYLDLNVRFTSWCYAFSPG